jgi:hypothetical protein
MPECPSFLKQKMSERVHFGVSNHNWIIFNCANYNNKFSYLVGCFCSIMPLDDYLPYCSFGTNIDMLSECLIKLAKLKNEEINVVKQ